MNDQYADKACKYVLRPKSSLLSASETLFAELWPALAQAEASPASVPPSSLIPTHFTALCEHDSWLWLLFNKERDRQKRDAFTNHVADKTIGTVLPNGGVTCTVDHLRALRDDLAQTPEGGALVFIIALINYASADNQAEGMKMVILSMWEENVVKSEAPGNFNGYILHRSDLDRLNRISEATARSYVRGTSPDNSYTIAAGSIEIGFRSQSKHAGSERSGTKKVFVWSSGADTARPITLKRNTRGLWKVSEFSSLLVGVRPAAGSDGGPADRAADVL